MKNPNEEPNPNEHLWVYGKSEPGWYMAKWLWSDWFANLLKSQGYEVRRGFNKPTERI